MEIGLLARKVAERLRRHGLLATLRLGWFYVTKRQGPDAFDRANGTDTAAIIPLWQLQIASENRKFGHRYQALEDVTMQAALDALPEPPARFAFIDIGCGKGRPLIHAARHGFRRVVGVEFAPELVAIAQANLAKLRIGNASFWTGDAAEYRFPEEDQVVFLNNAFGPGVIRPLLDNLYAVAGRRVYFLYIHPQHPQVLAESSFLQRLPDATANPNVQLWVARP